MTKKIVVKTIILLFFIIIVLIPLSGCNNKDELTEFNDNHKIIEIKAGNDIIINSSDITKNATYYNYTTDDQVIIQIFAVRATDNTIRVLFNTCGSCNPSPEAYFIQNGDYFECQNCGNEYHRDEIGLTKSYGCSPIAILDENKTIKGNTITISSSFIETYKSDFSKINIYEN